MREDAGAIGAGHADAGGDAKRFLVERDLLGLQRLADFVGHLGGGVRVRLRQHQGEFFTAVTRRQVDVPDGKLQQLSDGLEHFVAGLVAVRVVDLLEVIEVDEEDGQGALEFEGADELVVEKVVEAGAVGQAGEGIGGGFDLEGFVFFLDGLDLLLGLEGELDEGLLGFVEDFLVGAFPAPPQMLSSKSLAASRVEAPISARRVSTSWGENLKRAAIW